MSDVNVMYCDFIEYYSAWLMENYERQIASPRTLIL